MITRTTANTWTTEAVHRLGTTTDIETAGAVLDIGRTKAYELAGTGPFPVSIIKAGRRYRVPFAHSRQF